MLDCEGVGALGIVGIVIVLNWVLFTRQPLLGSGEVNGWIQVVHNPSIAADSFMLTGYLHESFSSTIKNSSSPAPRTLFVSTTLPFEAITRIDM